MYVTFGSVLGHLDEAHAVLRTVLDARGRRSERQPPESRSSAARSSPTKRETHDSSKKQAPGVLLGPREPARGGLATLGPGDVVPPRRAIEAVLREPSYRRMAGLIAGAIVRTPTLEETLAELVARPVCA